MEGGSPQTIKVNRAPVLTLWAAVAAERLGFTHDEALTLGRAVAGLNAYSNGVSLGLIHPAPEAVREQRKKLQKGKTLTVALLGRAVPVARTPDGLRALSKDKPCQTRSPSVSGADATVARDCLRRRCCCRRASTTPGGEGRRLGGRPAGGAAGIRQRQGGCSSCRAEEWRRLGEP